ncbi:MAG: Bax inhibitor-1/YccA family protein [Bacilli bacterium]|nr:Bax inhibitor-1/YccA family protein [Bacilli bacterium]MBN2696107.1 Bax inhibitor-1/YccA family protein [Bacilli bacterium]
MRLRSSNPVIKTVDTHAIASERPVTYANVTIKTTFLLAIAAISGVVTVMYLSEIGIGLLIGALIVGFISVLVGTRSVALSPYFSVIYALSEGMVLGVLSAMYAYLYEGIVPTAIMTTGIVLLVMMLLYSSGVIKVTQKFASVMVVALISVIFMALLSLILPFGGTLYLVVALISAVLSALFLLLDFESIKNCVDSGTDSRYGWVLSLGLLVTIVWVYLEVLRLLAIFARNRN